MKKTAVLIAVLCPILWVRPLGAQTIKKGEAYLGGSLFYSNENFDLKIEGYRADVKNAFGAALKGGYFISDNLALEGLLRYHFDYDFKTDGTLTGSEIIDEVTVDWELNGDMDGDIRLYDFTINLKGYLPAMEQFRPYGLIGVGYMIARAKWEVTGTGYWWLADDEDIQYPYSDSWDDDETDQGFCGRLGGGVELMVSENAGIDFEFSYNLGFGDVDEARFTAFNLGAIFYL